MTPWHNFWAHLAAHGTRCHGRLIVQTEQGAAGDVAVIAACRLCWWHAVVLLHRGEYPHDGELRAQPPPPGKESST